MSKIKNLKTLSGNTINLIDMLEMLCPIKKTKYIEILYRITKSNSKENKSYYDEIKTSCIKEYGVSEEKINELNDFQLIIFYSFIERLFYSKNMVNFKRFCELNELGLIKQNDLTKYSSFDEINNQVNVAELKIVDKEMEKEVIKIYEDDEWLLVKPLTYFSSKKYGSNTKWCTTSDDDPEYFKRYSREGVLIYIINKFTGIKVGAYNEISGKETSFWNQVDDRVDSLMLDLPSSIMDVIKKEFTNKEIKSNRFYLSSDQAKIEDQRVTSYETKIRSHIHEVIHNRSIEDILDDLEDDLEDDFTIPTPGPTRA